MNALTGRRQHGFALRRDGSRYPQLMAVLAAALFLSGGASTRDSAVLGVEQIGGRESTLADCSQHGRLCAGLTVAVLDLEVAAGRVCFPDGVTLEQAEDVIAEALKAGTSNEAAQVAVDAIRAAWPCASAPTDSRNYAVISAALKGL